MSASNPQNTESESYRLGLKMRRKVLGQAYGAKLEAHAAATARQPGAAGLADAFTQLASEHLWAATWPREGLDERSRRIATMGVMIALNAREELTLHIDAAIACGQLSKQEIKEMIFHATSYVGYPPALSALNQFTDPG